MKAFTGLFILAISAHVYAIQTLPIIGACVVVLHQVIPMSMPMPISTMPISCLSYQTFYNPECSEQSPCQSMLSNTSLHPTYRTYHPCKASNRVVDEYRRPSWTSRMVVVDLVAVVDEPEDVRALDERRAFDRLMRDMGLRRIVVACAEACGVSCCEAAVLPSRKTSATVKVNKTGERTCDCIACSCACLCCTCCSW